MAVNLPPSYVATHGGVMQPTDESATMIVSVSASLNDVDVDARHDVSIEEVSTNIPSPRAVNNNVSHTVMFFKIAQ